MRVTPTCPYMYHMCRQSIFQLFSTHCTVSNAKNLLSMLLSILKTAVSQVLGTCSLGWVDFWQLWVLETGKLPFLPCLSSFHFINSQIWKILVCLVEALWTAIHSSRSSFLWATFARPWPIFGEVRKRCLLLKGEKVWVPSYIKPHIGMPSCRCSFQNWEKIKSP